MSDDHADDAYGLLNRKAEQVMAEMAAAPERAAEYLIAHQDHALRYVGQEARPCGDSGRNGRPAAFAAHRAQRNVPGRWLPPPAAFRIEVARLMYDVVRLAFAPKGGAR